MPKKALEKILEQTEQKLELLKELGINSFPREKVEPIFRKKTLALKRLREEIGDCQRCGLAKTRARIVFGEGDPSAEVVFVGEAPGEKEDLSGKPFVGPAGKLLTDIIELGMRIPRSRVYICNVVKCRPPENRDPKREEISACQRFLKKQLDIVQPKVIIALGKHSAQWLLEKEEPISQLRGKWGEYNGIMVMPTYHPAYLLYNRAGKRELWMDIKKVIEYLKKGEIG